VEIILVILALIGLITVVTFVLYEIECAIKAIKAFKSRPRPDPKMPAHWKRNTDQKLVNKPYVYVVRDDGAYIRIEREFGFLTFVWEDQGVRAFVSHWDPRENRQDLELKGNFYDAIDKADQWFHMGRDVTHNIKVAFWIAHNKERRAGEHA